jgi:hypothetical protein
MERRKAYKESLPPLIFSNIYVTGVTDEQRNYIISQLTRDMDGDFTWIFLEHFQSKNIWIAILYFEYTLTSP